MCVHDTEAAQVCTFMCVCESDNQMLLGERKVKVTESVSWRFTCVQVQVYMHVCVRL